MTWTHLWFRCFLLLPLAGSFLLAPLAVRADEVPRAVVLPLKSENFEPATLEALDEILAVEVSTHTPFQLVTKGDINAQLEHETLKDALGCDETGCAAELAGALNARYLLTGTIRKFAYNITVTLSLIDTQEEITKRAQGKSEDNIVFYEDAVKMAVRNLFDVQDPPKEEANTENEEAPTPATKANAQPSSARKSLLQLTLGQQNTNLQTLQQMQQKSQDAAGPFGEKSSGSSALDSDFFAEEESVALETMKWFFTVGAAAGVALVVLGAAEMGPVQDDPDLAGGFVGGGAALLGTGALLWVIDLTDIFE